MNPKHLQRVRHLCLALPETSERRSHGEPTFFVRNRVFTMFADDHHHDGRVAVWLPVPPGMQQKLVQSRPRTFFKPPYVGVGGWVGIELRQIRDRELNFFVQAAWELIASKQPVSAQRPKKQGQRRARATSPPRPESGFAIKADVADPRAKTFAFEAQKTMYGGRHIAEGDTAYIFASETQGGSGLVARGVVTSVRAIARRPGVARQTPRVSVTIRRTAVAKRRLGRSELRSFSDWKDGRPETELNFKFYRQATNKIVGLSDQAAAFLQRHF